MSDFVHLHVHSCYSFLDGADDPEDLARAAAELGMNALALTDHNSLAAAVKFTIACKQYGVTPILGSELTLSDDSHITLIARDRRGYADLCRLLEMSYAEGGRLTPGLRPEALENNGGRLFCLTGCRKGRIASLVSRNRYTEAEEEARRLSDWFPDGRLLIELQDDLYPKSRQVCKDLSDLARHLGLRAVATNNVHHAQRDQASVHDVLCCIRAGITVQDRHPARPLNAERYLKSPKQMAELFAWNPAALLATRELVEQCTSALPDREQISPKYPTPNGQTSQKYLRELTIEAAKERYGSLNNGGLNNKVCKRLDNELGLIDEFGFNDYFLVAWHVANWARSQGIRVSGRGSAADCCVSYCLKLTDVDVIDRNLPMARFLAPGKIPDIDLDFPSDRREEVFRFIEREFGKGNVAMACTFNCYHARSALRDVGKVFAMPPELLRFFSSHFSSFMPADDLPTLFERYPELRKHTHLIDRFQRLFAICGKIAGHPRHIGTHSSGVVIGGMPLRHIAPVIPTARDILPALQLDKDDVEEVGAVKLDILALRTLAAVEDTEQDIRRTRPDFRYDDLPNDDDETFEMIRRGDAVGAFQLESPAQIALAGKLQPNEFEHIIASVALIRPGPIRSNAVHDYVERARGRERQRVHHHSLAEALRRTYGCVIYQEQVISIIATLTGCTEVEADRFRKSLTYHIKHNTLDKARQEFIQKAKALHNDLTQQKAERIWLQIESWGEFGFAEGHAASFAQHAIRTAFLVTHHISEYFAAMMSNQPMGYYCVQTLASAARRRGVDILPIDINRSGVKCYGERTDAIRLGLCLIEGLKDDDAEAIVAERERGGPFHSLLEFCARITLRRNSLESLVLSRAFEGLHTHPRGLLWRLDETIAIAQTLRAEAGAQSNLVFGSARTHETPIASEIAEFSEWEQMVAEWKVTGVTANCHPMAYLRAGLGSWRLQTVNEALEAPTGEVVTVAALNLCPHRPPTRSGRTVLFTSLEDETGVLQSISTGEALASYAETLLMSPVVFVRGAIERQDRTTSIIVRRARPLEITDELIARAALANSLSIESVSLPSWPGKVRAYGHY